MGYIDQLIDAYGMPGFVAEEDGKIIGSLTWRECEGFYQVFTLISDVEGRGIGSELLKRAEADAAEKGYKKVLISTENSYIDALAFYQKRGYTLFRVHFNVMAALRQMKPSIPEVDTNGIPIRDQIDLIKDIPPPAM